MKQIIKKIFCFISRLPFISKRNQKKPEHPQKILLMMCHWLGDTFWAMQTIPMLRQKYPDSEFYVLCRASAKDLFHTLIDEKHLIFCTGIISDRNRESFSLRKYLNDVKTVHSLSPEMVIDFTWNRYSAIFTRLLGRNVFTAGLDAADEFSGLYSMTIHLQHSDSLSQPRKAMRIAESLTGLKGADKMFPPVPDYGKEEIQNRYHISDQEKLIMIAPGAGWPGKKWQLDKFKEIAEYTESHGYRVLLSGSPSEQDDLKHIAHSLQHAVILCGKLRDTIAFLPHLKLFLGNDSGTTNLAAAFQIPVIAFFCSTSPDFLNFGANVKSVCTDCPHHPTSEQQFCCGAPKYTCDSPYFMNTSTEKVIQLLKDIL